MGCDIHINCEIKTSDGYWENCDFFTIDPTYKSLKGDPERPPKWLIKQVDVGRNYALFGVLAGVRDRSHPMISEPRGIPDNISKQTKKRYLRESEWGCHSYSWLTLKELLDYRTQYENKYCCGYVTDTGLENINIYGSPEPEHVEESVKETPQDEPNELVDTEADTTGPDEEQVPPTFWERVVAWLSSIFNRQRQS